MIAVDTKSQGAVTEEPVLELRQEVHALAERLPKTATWGDVLEYARYRMAVQDGLAEARRGEFASEDDLRRMYAKFGIAS